MTNYPIIEGTDPDITIEEFFDIDRSMICPDCEGEVESGTGFGRRDLECADEECGWSASMRLDRYREGD